MGDTLAAALGRTHRHDPVADGTAGLAGNARLTAWTGLLLLGLSVAEVITLINVGGLISWHLVIGTLLIPPALLKTVSTGWRIAHYYSGTPPYRHAGPPPMLLRILGPGVIAFTLGLLATGVLLVFLGGEPESHRSDHRARPAPPRQASRLLRSPLGPHAVSEYA